MKRLCGQCFQDKKAGYGTEDALSQQLILNRCAHE